LLHDPVPHVASGGVVQRDREALARVARWHGPGERKAAVLALLADGDERGWQAWSEETRGLAVAAAVRAEVESLGPAARL
ncbi:hypothetical protein OFM15_33380, partial [Escherichia coli]|nr:hypothetical protein [Escherichia coli]